METAKVIVFARSLSSVKKELVFKDGCKGKEPGKRREEAEELPWREPPRPPGDSNPRPREDPKSRSLKGVPIKYTLVARVPNEGIYFLDPPGGLGFKGTFWEPWLLKKRANHHVEAYEGTRDVFKGAFKGIGKGVIRACD